MGNLLALKTVFNPNWFKIVWHIPGWWEQLFQLEFVHTGGGGVEVFKEVQEDEFWGDDDISAEYADEGLDWGGSFDGYCWGVCVSELLYQVKVQWFFMHFNSFMCSSFICIEN